MLFTCWCKCGNERCDMPEMLTNNMQKLRPVRMQDSVTPFTANSALLRSLASRAARTAPAFVHVMQSTIPGAGIGVFATCNIPKSVNLGEYSGHVYSTDTDRAFDDYLFEVDADQGRPAFLVSARQYNSRLVNWTRFINSVMTEDDPKKNTEFKVIGQRVYIFTTDYITASVDNPKELLIYYGEDTADFIH